MFAGASAAGADAETSRQSTLQLASQFMFMASRVANSPVSEVFHLHTGCFEVGPGLSSLQKKLWTCMCGFAGDATEKEGGLHVHVRDIKSSTIETTGCCPSVIKVSTYFSVS